MTRANFEDINGLYITIYDYLGELHMNGKRYPIMLSLFYKPKDGITMDEIIDELK